MALIMCPECQNQISDRAVSCPNCGYPLALSATENSTYDIHENLISSSQENAHYSKARRKKRINRLSIIAIICIIITVFLVGLALFAVIKRNQLQAEKEAQELAAIAARAAYIENLESFMLTALSGAAEAENVCNLTKAVWYDTIYEEYDSKTSDYTQTNGIFHDDFNASLSKLYCSNDMLQSVKEIKQNQTSTEEIYKKLLDPTPEFERCFRVLEELYSAYYNLTKLAISPSGSLKTYSDNFSEYDTAFIEQYDKLKLLIPEE